jgi:hypothetical protein
MTPYSLRSTRTRARRLSLFVIVAVAVVTAWASGASAAASALRFTITWSNTEITVPTTTLSPVQADLTYCNWLNGIPDAPIVDSYVAVGALSTKCNPLSPGKSFGLMEAPQTARLDDEVLRIARLDPKTHRISIGPILMTSADAAGARPQLASADGSIWVYDPYTTRGSEVLRFSATSGTLLQETTMPQIGQPITSANDVGFWIGADASSSGGTGIYLAQIGATSGRLVQATSDNVTEMTGSGDSMTVYAWKPPLDSNSTDNKEIRIVAANS